MSDDDQRLRIGILGAARIAPMALVKPARVVDRVEVTAVAARSRDRARAFADKHGIARVLGSYEELVADPDIDAVYNPLPNALHARWTIAALEAGKHVLCEKPLTSNAAEARAVAEVASASGRVLMEAFHYRYHPLMAAAIEVVRSGELGELEHLDAWMQVPLFKPGDIRFDPALGGGATMDLGCYTIHQLRTLAGEEPRVVGARAKQRPVGIDRWMRGRLQFPSGASGAFTVSLWGAVPLRLGFRVSGTQGSLKVMNPTLPHAYARFTVRTHDGRRHERFPRIATYRYQLEAFAAAVLDARPVLTGPVDSIANMSVIDAIYAAAGMDPRQ